MDCTINPINAGRHARRRAQAVFLFSEISELCSIAFFEWPKADAVPKKELERVVSGPFAFGNTVFGLESEDELLGEG